MNFKKTVLPHVIAVIVFTAITTIFYSPLVFSGKSINQHDIQQGLGASQEIIDYRNNTGEEALWTNSMFGGMPAYLINTQWSGDLMLYVHRTLSLWLPSAAGVTLVSCITFYILLLVFGVRPWLAIAGGLAYSLGSFNIISIEVGHMWKMWAIAYMPLVLAGAHLAFQKKYLLGFALTAVGLALELRSNHLQITYYLLILLLIYGAVLLIFAIRDKQVSSLFKPLSYLVVAALLALLCNIGKLWSVYEYGKYSTRGPSELTQGPQEASSGLDREYAFRWSNGIMEPLTLLIPGFFGGPSVSSLPLNSHLGEALRDHGQPPVQVRQYLQQVRTYWGDQPLTAGPSYAGAVIIFLFILGLSLISRKDRAWLVTAILLSVMLSWGHNFEVFNNLMFDYFPGYNKFRSVSMTLVIALLCIPLAALLGLEKLAAGREDPAIRKKLIRAGLITGGVLLASIIFAGIGNFRGAVDEQMTGQVPPWYLEALKADRASLLRNDAIRSLIFIALAWLAVFYYLRNKLSAAFLYIGIISLTLVDLWGVNKRYLQKEDYISTSNTGSFVATEADRLILQDSDPNYRVLSYLQNPWNEARTSFFHKSLGGYHGAKLHRYADVIEGCLDKQFRDLLQDLQAGGTIGSFSIINMLNTKYLLAGTEAGGVLKNEHALGHAWFVPEVSKVNSADEEFAQLCSFDPAKTALVDQSKFPLGNTTFSTQGNLELAEYLPNYLKYKVQNQGPGFAVFSEIYYPEGWQATIDGEPVTILRANYLLRALQIPAGQHTIEFRFAPKAYIVGNKIMMVASLLTILLLAGIVIWEVKKRRPFKNDHQ